MHVILKEYLIFAALLLFGGASWQWSASYFSRKTLVAQPISARSPVANQPTRVALPGTGLPGPCRVLLTPRPGHVEQVYVSEGQPVQPGDLLLKLAVGHDSNVKMVFVFAPAAGALESVDSHKLNFAACAAMN